VDRDRAGWHARIRQQDGSVTLVLLPLKYEIDDSVTGESGALYAYGRDIGLQTEID